MTSTDQAPGSSWVPNSCTLPTVDQPLRVQEFDNLFHRSVTDVARTSATSLRLSLTAEPDVAAAAAALAARESHCCGFFTFTLVVAPLDLHLTIDVPAEHSDVLDALGRRAATRL